jgi:cysteinyl-tRNA synthetase
MKYLGEQFDIHTGGIDHLAIHHPNEIAQSEAATGKKPFVKYWVHHNFLTVDGEKMSKSKGNFFTILDIEAKGFEPMALRLLFLQSHYRSQLNFTWESLEAAQTSWNKLKRMLADWQGLADKYAQFSSEAQAYQEQFINFIENDLKTPEAVAVLWEVVKSDLPKKEKRALLLEFDQILGLGLNQITADQTGQVAIEDLPAEIQQLLDKRNQARQDQDWSSADKIRQQISKLGYQVEDTPQGQAVRRSSSAPIKLKPYVK